MRSWYLNWKASRLVGRGDFASARQIYARLVAMDGADSFALLMLAMCCEREGHMAEALRAAEQAVRVGGSLPALQAAARLAIEAQEHGRAAEYVELALALPELRTEMPQDMRVENAIGLGHPGAIAAADSPPSRPS